MQGAKVVNFRKGNVIYREGFPAEGVFLVCRGSIKLTTVGESGAERIASFAICGELFGLDCMFPEPVRYFSAVAREPAQAAFLSTAHFHKALHSRPELLWKVSLMINEMFHRADRDKLAISGSRVRKRIESVLIDLGQRAKHSEGAGKPAFARLSQRELAETLGVPEETVCRELRAIKSDKSAGLQTMLGDGFNRTRIA